MHFSFYKAVFLLSAFTIIALSSCNPTAKAVSGMEVSIDMTLQEVSAGFATVRFNTNQEAYYHVGIIPAADLPDTTNNAAVRSFMKLKLDAAYTDYINWRHSLLADEVPFIADFAAHSLQYGEVDYPFTFLTPDSSYFVYAFVVNATTINPDGRLFLKPLTTSPESSFLDTRFEYRIRGTWEYIYPIDNTTGQIRSVIPWSYAAADSLDLRETFDDDEFQSASVSDIFALFFAIQRAQYFEGKIRYGIYARNTAIETSDTMLISFEEGHTYYVGMAQMDGYEDYLQGAMDIYRFRWLGDSTNLFFTDSMHLTTPW